MKPKEDIEQFVANIDLETQDDRDRHVLGTVLKAHEDRPQQRQSPTWRIIMKSNTTKLATAAMILLALGLSVAILDHLASPAWALDQTVEALKQVEAIYIAGRLYHPESGSEKVFEMWGRPHSTDPTHSGDFRLREGDDHVAVASPQENLTYLYERHAERQTDVVYITEGLNRDMTTFYSGDVLAEFRAMAQDWKEEYRKDPETGRDCVFVTFRGAPVNTASYWRLQIDLETKLPVHAGVWYAPDRQGRPHYEFTEMKYNPEIPEGWFDFQIPAGAQIIDTRKLRSLLKDGDSYGVSVEGLDTREACWKVVKAYWDTVIARDWSQVQALRPLATGQALLDLQAAYQNETPVESVSIGTMNHLDDPATFAEVSCVVRLKDGSTREALLNVELYPSADGPIGVVAGCIGPELYKND